MGGRDAGENRRRSAGGYEPDAQILSIDDRRNVNELVDAMVKEARRRGMTYDTHPVTLEGRLIEDHPGTNHAIQK